MLHFAAQSVADGCILCTRSRRSGGGGKRDKSLIPLTLIYYALEELGCIDYQGDEINSLPFSAEM